MQVCMHCLSVLQILHAYMAEPYAPWAGLSRGSEQYQQLKQQRAEQLWGLIDQVGADASRGEPCHPLHIRQVGTLQHVSI